MQKQPEYWINGKNELCSNGGFNSCKILCKDYTELLITSINELMHKFSIPSHKARELKRIIATAKNIEKQKEWWDVLSPEIVEWANKVLDESSEDKHCVDNYRVARCGNSSQNRRYRRYLQKGCCGFADFIAIGPDGNQYRLGFNYGH